ncbi:MULTISPECIES: hypothetical protein [unclassified Campylobacter]|uniref:hypothetical protein n=1 Tax=unclassified Campylobacter TaxID=2593542 RepID=UPI002B05756F
MSFFVLMSANDFSQKKILKIQKNNDIFELIDLNQEETSKNLNQQKAIFDSSNVKDKKLSLNTDEDIDFALFVSYKPNFAYVLDSFKVVAKDFSALFTQNFINTVKLHFANAAANAIYQNQKTLNAFSTKNSHILDVAPFLKKEKNKNQIYAKFLEYLLVITLNDFYIELTNFFIGSSQDAYALLNYKIISLSSGKIVSAKNVKLRLKLDKEKNAQENYKEVVSQMPLLLSKLIQKEVKKYSK